MKNTSAYVRKRSARSVRRHSSQERATIVCLLAWSIFHQLFVGFNLKIPGFSVLSIFPLYFIIDFVVNH